MRTLAALLEAPGAIRALLLLFILAAPTADAAAQSNHASVAGRVVDTTGAPIAGATLTLRPAEPQPLLVGTTDSSGRFTFEGLAPGEYALEALAPSFSLRAAQVVLTGGEARLIDLTLAPGTFTETVTVIATHLGGRPETLARIPGSIEIIDPLMLTASRPFNFSEALRKGSGINVRDEEGLGLRPNIGIRGLSPTRSTKVLLLEDGIPVTYAPYGDNVSYYHPPLERFEAVEILKGSGKSPTDR